MNYEGIIYDLDGVICFTDQYHYEAWKVIADRLHIAFDETVNHRLRGVSRMESLEIILEGWPGAPFSPEEKEEMATEKNEIYKGQLQQMTPADLKPAVKNTLEILKKRGFAQAIGSSSKNTALILQRLGLEGFFDAVADGTMITRSKPDPEVFLLAAEKLNLPPGACLVVEDAEAGIEAASRGGFDSAGIGPAASLPGLRFSLRSLDELPGLVGTPGTPSQP